MPINLLIPIILIILSLQLNSDDFNYCAWAGKECFSYLGQQTSKFYSPSIDSPVSYLRSRVWNGAVKTVNAADQFSVAAGETVFVTFTDNAAHRTQNDRLAAHDAQISKIVTRLGTQHIVYIYTAIEDHETNSRVARQAPPTPNPEAVTPWEARGDQYVIRIAEVTVETDDKKTNIPLTGVPTFVKGSDTTAKLTLPTTPVLEMEFVQDGSRWFVEKLTYNGNLFTSGTLIGSNDGFSFACTPDVRYVSPNETSDRLNIRGLQVQINLSRDPTKETYKMAFSEAWNCVGFTSPGIWGGLFVTILLLFIMTIGISWMLDIRTMDRFDDPKAKTITINAQD